VSDSDWSAPAKASDADSNLRYRALEVVAQIMDLDLSKESDIRMKACCNRIRRTGQEVLKSS